MKELKIIWGKKATDQRNQILEASSSSTMGELIDKALKYMGTLQTPMHYDTPDGWFTKTTWNKWGEGVEMMARVDFPGGFLFIMEIHERSISRSWMPLRMN